MQIDKDKLIGELYCYVRALEEELQRLRVEATKDDEQSE